MTAQSHEDDDDPRSSGQPPLHAGEKVSSETVRAAVGGPREASDEPVSSETVLMVERSPPHAEEKVSSETVRAAVGPAREASDEPVSSETVLMVDRPPRGVSVDTVRASVGPPRGASDGLVSAETMVATVGRPPSAHEQVSAETVAVVELGTAPGSGAVPVVAPRVRPVRADDPPTRPRDRRFVLRGAFFAVLLAGLVWGVVEVGHLFSIQRQGPRVASTTGEPAQAELKAEAPAAARSEAPEPGEDPDSEDARYPGLRAQSFLRTHVKEIGRDSEGHINDAGEGSIVELGGSDAIALQTVTVVNLWATWCKPCRNEFTGFQKMFTLNARDQGWGSETRFVPILVDDAENARTAYSQFSNAMPRIHAPLVDLKLDQNGVRGALQEIKQLPPDAELPVTLLFDCRRRIRWSKIGALDQATFNSLADEIDSLRAELRQDKCKIKRPEAPPNTVTAAPPPSQPPPAIKRTCNHNKKCDRGEDCGLCPRECPCKKGEKCNFRPDGQSICKEVID